jgi:hypothetical protein
MQPQGETSRERAARQRHSRYNQFLRRPIKHREGQHGEQEINPDHHPGRDHGGVFDRGTGLVHGEITETASIKFKLTSQELSLLRAIQ